MIRWYEHANGTLRYGRKVGIFTVFGETLFNLGAFRNVFYFDYSNPLKSRKVCVKTCPNVTLTTVNEFNMYTVDNPLCLYNVPAGPYRQDMCPSLPVLAT